MTALEQAQDELANSMIPHPDIFLEDYTPQAALLFARQVAMATTKICMTWVRDTSTDLSEESPAANGMMNGCAAGVVGFTHALVALGVLPLEAEEALASPA